MTTVHADLDITNPKTKTCAVVPVITAIHGTCASIIQMVQISVQTVIKEEAMQEDIIKEEADLIIKEAQTIINKADDIIPKVTEEEVVLMVVMVNGAGITSRSTTINTLSNTKQT